MKRYISKFLFLTTMLRLQIILIDLFFLLSLFKLNGRQSALK
jgi:hypothetical protein